MKNKLRMVSLFSGIGAFESGLTRANINHEVVGFSEIDKYAIEAYSALHGIDKDKNIGDVSTVELFNIPDCDLITYGFPCQDISVSGLGRGIIEGETRSGLLFEALRIIKEKKPRYAIAENVKNLIGKRFKNDFDSLLKELESYGYNNYWQVLNAKDYGVPQNRERVFVVSIRKDIDDGLFEFPNKFDEGLRLKDLLEESVDSGYYIDRSKTQSLLENLKTNDVTQHEIICAERGRYNKLGKIEQRLEIQTSGNSNALTTVQKDNMVLECNKLDFIGGIDSNKRIDDGKELSRNYKEGYRVYSTNGLATCQKSNGGGLGGCTGLYGVKVKEATKKGYAIARVGDSINIEHPNSKTRRGRVGKGMANTLTTGCNQATLVEDYRVRRLTPLECWRLMGFSDNDYYKAKEALELEFYNGKDRSKSQMYKMAGNSIVVNVLEEILKSLLKDYTIS